jgi:predicted nucleic acid-binding protein
LSFLLDTNVVSESVRPRPDRGVLEWLAEADEDLVFISVITLAELRRGVARLPTSRRRSRLDQWLRDELPLRFAGRIFGIDEKIAAEWGDVVAEREAAGRAISTMDAFIAAITRVHGLTLITRNVADFQESVAAIVNPWSDAG